MFNKYNPMHMFFASYGNELNRIHYKPILRESRNSNNPSLTSFTYNGLLYTFYPELNMFVNQFGHAMDHEQAVALANSMGYGEQEFEGFEDNSDTDGDPHRSVLNIIQNLDLFGVFWTPPYGFWNQEEQWPTSYNDTKGLTYFYPPIAPGWGGNRGPSRALLASGNFNGALNSLEPTWPGIGFGTTNSGDIPASIAPWNTSTGYIGLTFGATGFLQKEDVLQDIRDFSWIPPDKRTLYPFRHWRYYGGSGILNSEHFIPTTGAKTSQEARTPWLKRKMNFARAELKAAYSVMGACGFTMGSLELDDEFYNNFDFRGANETAYRTVFLYPQNSITGATWYANYTGISATPDCYVLEGITSFKQFLITLGWTSNASLPWKFVDGITFLGGAGGEPGNAAANGSSSQWQGSELFYALRDWVAGYNTDLINDFKLAFGLTQDNNSLSAYGYYITNVGTFNYNPNNQATSNTLTGYKFMSPNEAVPYPYATSASSREVIRYYAFDKHDVVGGFAGTGTRRSGNMDSIHTYGNNVSLTTFDMTYDRDLYLSGNSYGTVYGGKTFGIEPVYAFHFGGFGAADRISGNRLRTWYPSQYLGNTTTVGGQLLQDPNGSYQYACTDPIGLSAATRFGGSCATNCPPTRCGNFGPNTLYWHLNPVWGINRDILIGNTAIGPANYVPIAGKDIVVGVTVGAYTVVRNRSRGSGGGFTAWAADDFDPCGFAVPGNTLPPGSIYKHYWTHWYPVTWVALLSDISWGRHVALNNVYKAVIQRENPAQENTNSRWNKIQKPITVHFADQKWPGDDAFNEPSKNGFTPTETTRYLTPYYEPTGITYGIYFYNTGGPGAKGVTVYTGEAGPFYYENIRHQYLHKMWKVAYWNPVSYSSTWSPQGAQIYVENQMFPRSVNGFTTFGVCGAIAMAQARKINDVVHECNTLGGGIVSETMYLVPVNHDEREYIISGAQLVNGNYLWRISFAHPVTNPSGIYIRGSVRGDATGVTYNVAGITNYIKIGNNKFGVWWTSDVYELPIVTNPPIAEAQRLGVLNLPESGITYNPYTMIRGATAGGVPIYIT